ncbi:MAG TPA: RES family NAD+ phosphorylase [Flavisolibacter sp.]|jgi:RES domain-containing protein|nr:RES family NAD+ phosphorylase [Flavisolibacter sp.]
MIVYRITLKKWANALTASGRAARWNSNGHFMIYTSGSRALACLENIVHRSGAGLHALFSVMEIDIPDKLDQSEIRLKQLPPDWTDYLSYAHCQALGDAWLQKGETALLKVPSAIIAEEWNVLINPAHPDFAKIRLLRTEDFVFDSRLSDRNKK